MRRIFTMVLLLVSLGLCAQNYNNEWIDFNKTYYKFKLGATGLCRIPQSTLAAAGLGNAPAQNFQLFRNGQEVPIYTSVPSGPLGANDYIEFWGQRNDGVPDQALYRNPTYQHTQYWSLETDTATYYLTVNPTGNVFHYASASNDTTNNTLAPEPYLWYTTGTHFHNQINPGFAQVVAGEFVYSSSYDIGEFWSSNEFYPSGPLNDNLFNLYIYPQGPAASISFGMVGVRDTLRTVSLKVNGTTILNNAEMDGFYDLVSTQPVPLGLLAGNSANVQFVNNCATPSDLIVASFYELSYPRQFNFGGSSSFPFTLPARGSGFFLKINNFNIASGLTPVLYDMTNGQRYVGIIGASNVLTFLLPGSAAARNLVLVNESSSIVTTITGLTAKQFTNFANSSIQGNYLIITDPVLFTGTSGNNPINDYKAYRSSATGGGYNVQIYDVNELIDQFGYGIKKNPIAIQNFLRYARTNFSAKPQYTLLIGHGLTYVDYNTYSEQYHSPLANQLDLVPTFGWPASDNKLSSGNALDAVPATPIGRLSVISGAEVENYLNKVKEYEQTQTMSANTIDGKLWMKNVLQLTGASEPYLGTILCNAMSNYKKIMTDTLFGATVTTLCDGNSSATSQVPGNLIPNLFATGMSILNYFGHSSNSVLGYNLNSPLDYNNTGKYPVFYVNGCDAGDFFVYDPLRFGTSMTLSEGWVLAKEKGSIAFVASTHLGVVTYLDVLLNGLFTLINNGDYGKTIGTIQKDALQRSVSVAPNDYFSRLHAEEMTLHGDPALYLNQQPLPDYDVEASQVVINPSFISVSNNSFTVNAKFYNLGKAVNDSITVLVQRQYPDGSIATVLKKRIHGIIYSDSIQLTLPIIATRDKGQNKIIVTINSDKNVQEVTYANNSVTANVFIYQNEANPVYPYDLSIINTPTTRLIASTANPLSPVQQYVMEIDTTQLFNSPLKVSRNLNSIGGELEFDPGISFMDSVVYYWRVGITPSTPGGSYLWNNASFVYIDPAHSSVGYNQSHYYQHLQSTGDSMSLAANRVWTFGNTVHNFYLSNAMYPQSSYDQDFSVMVDGDDYIASACLGNSLIFSVFDPVSFKAWKNVDANGNNLNLSGSANANCQPNRNWNFEFSYLYPQSRYLIMRFMDSIPNGYIVTIRTSDANDPLSFSKTWEADTSLFGSGKSLYHYLLNAGFTQIDSLNQIRDWQMIYIKGSTTFQPMSNFSLPGGSKITLSANITGPLLRGSVTSPKFGPAKKWNTVHWRGNELTSPVTDVMSIEVIGVDSSGNSAILYNLNNVTQDFDISAIDANKYPYVQLKLITMDTIHAKPFQLNYWRLNYVPVPEGALAPNILFKSVDSVQLGEPVPFQIAFKNVSPYNFDSLKIQMYVLDKSNVQHAINLPKTKPLVPGDTTTLSYTIDSKAYAGNNTIFLEYNPNYAQPEQYLFNNFVYKNFFVKSENRNPLLDVTFDNVHILNDDIVSAKPHIQIKLSSPSSFLLLTDTSTISVSVKYPDGSIHPYRFSNDTLRFTPATSGSHNVATVDFYPSFTNQINPNGDDYQLIVTGKDPSGNTAGSIPYRVSFKIISKAMISNLLNYPNPFTTSTAFVFTITGSEVPQNIKIQILTITGKIVREITKDELGPLHVGRNITEFKWNGTDMFGQRLANGVYLYHVVTNLNGKTLDKYQAAGDNTDKYFNNGYGKMYLMK